MIRTSKFFFFLTLSCIILGMYSICTYFHCQNTTQAVIFFCKINIVHLFETKSYTLSEKPNRSQYLSETPFEFVNKCCYESCKRSVSNGPCTWWWFHEILLSTETLVSSRDTTATVRSQHDTLLIGYDDVHANRLYYQVHKNITHMW